MRLQIDEMIQELCLRLGETKSLRNRVLLQQALKALRDFKRANEKPV